jgi:hypothetical protein
VQVRCESGAVPPAVIPESGKARTLSTVIPPRERRWDIVERLKSPSIDLLRGIFFFIQVNILEVG